MEPYEAGYATGQLAFTVCCIVTVLGAIGAAIWGGCRFAAVTGQGPTAALSTAAAVT